MSTPKDYIVQFSGLALGEHLFEIDVDDSFFESLAYSEIRQGTVRVNLTLLKRSNMLVLNFSIDGIIKTNCDTCAELFDLRIEGEYKLIVKYSDAGPSDEEDEIICIGPTEGKLDLTQHIYEYITLSLPIKRVHQNIEECDEEVVNKLNEFLIEDESKESTDPRWESLKNIKLN